MATYSGALTKLFTRVGPTSAGSAVGGAGTYAVAVPLAGPSSQSPAYEIEPQKTAQIRQIFTDAAGAGNHTVNVQVRRYNPFTAAYDTVISNTLISWSGSGPVYYTGSAIDLDEGDLLYINSISSTNGNPTFQIGFLIEENYASF